MKIVILIIVLLLIIWVIYSLWIDKNIESSGYTVIKKEKEYEVRKYQSYIVAETFVPKGKGKASSRGFRTLARYIFGGNHQKQSIAMTAPVTTQSTGQKIAMTAPVGNSYQDEGITMTFTMPAQYSMEDLPIPNSDNVKLKKIPEGTYAVLRFSGIVNDSIRIQKTKKLKDLLKKDNIATTGPAQLLQYDRSTKLPPLRRNEIKIAVDVKV